MRKIKVLTFLLALLCCATPGRAGNDFGLWSGISIEKKIIKGLNFNIEGDFRSRNNVRTVDRWSGSTGLSYNICTWLKTDVNYTFLYSYEPLEYTKAGNIIPEYWLKRHRFDVNFTEKWAWKRFRFSLRERWQYTYRPQHKTEKYDGRNGKQKENEVIKGKGKNNLRSRLKIEYDIPKCKFTPYVSCELTHDLHHGFYYEKTRCMAGTEWKMSKKHKFDFYYLFQVQNDNEPNLHVVGAKYAFKF